MKLTIIAATGGVGRQLLRQAPDARHDVTPVAPNPPNLPPHLRAATPGAAVPRGGRGGGGPPAPGGGRPPPGGRGRHPPGGAPPGPAPPPPRRTSPARRSPATTAPPWGGTCAAAGRSPAPTSPTTCSPCSASLGPSAKSSASPANRHPRGVTQITDQGTTTRLPEGRLMLRVA